MWGDEAVRQRLLASDDPRTHQRLGLQLSNFSEARWLQQREDMVYRGNMASFSQNPEVKKAPIETGERARSEARELVCAAPTPERKILSSGRGSTCWARS